MTRNELLEIIDKTGYGNSGMARAVNIPKTTLQRYVDGSAAIPDDVAEKVRAEFEKDQAFMARLPKFLDDLITRRFPNGIPIDCNYYIE